MSLKHTLQRFHEQFEWQPEVLNPEALQPASRYLVVGMGGSHIGAWMLKKYAGLNNITIHRDYGLPRDITEGTHVILSSYSGNTEEVIDAGHEARARGFQVSAISRGGALDSFAKDHSLPHIVFPDLQMQPRVAIGLSMLAITRLMQHAEAEDYVRTTGLAIDALADQEQGERIARSLTNRLPIIYASHSNSVLSFIWKIKLNESAKIPSFCNTFPEMCHNELCGYDTAESTLSISKPLYAVFLQDAEDHARVQLRMKVAHEVMGEKGVEGTVVELQGTGLTKAYRSAVLADWVALNLAATYGVPDEAVPLVEDFKKRLG